MDEFKGIKRFLVAILIVINLLGIIVAILSLNSYIGVNFGGSYISFCDYNTQYNCTLANTSKYASFLGLPTALYALFYYALSLLFLIIVFRSSFRRDILDFLTTLSFISVAVSLFLFYVSKYKLQVICPTCFAMYIINFAQMVLLLFIDFKRSIMQRIKGGLAMVFGKKKLSIYVILTIIITFVGVVLIYIFLKDRNANNKNIALMNNKPYTSMKYVVKKAISIWKEQPEKYVNINLDGKYKDLYVGNKDAKLVIVEFMDYQCPYCKIFGIDLQKILERYKNDILYVLKMYPLDMACNPTIPQPYHNFSCDMAKTVYCADRQGKFKEVDNLLLNWEGYKDAKDFADYQNRLNQELSKIDLNLNELSECKEGEDVENKIRLDLEDGARAGVYGTPTVLINKKILKSPNVEVIEWIIKEFVKK